MGELTSADVHRRVLGLKMIPNSNKSIVAVFVSLILLFAVAVRAQDKGKSDAPPESVRLTIVVTGGDEKKPVDSASVYVKYVTEGKLGKKNKIEMNLKTNLSGVCHVPDIPAGRFLVQVVADGWKAYGEYYDVTQPEQTINIALVRPPKWY